jgi:hypothetical protein
MSGVEPHRAPGGVTLDASDILRSLADYLPEDMAGLRLIAEHPGIRELELALPCVWREEDSITVYTGNMTIVGPNSRRMRLLSWLARPTRPKLGYIFWRLWYGR